MSYDDESVEARLKRARARGIDRFDLPRALFVERLLERATMLPEAAARLRDRAHEALVVLEADFEAHRVEAEKEWERLEAAGLDRRGDMRRALDAGDVRTVLREARRQHAITTAVHKLAERSAIRIRRRLEDRGSRSPRSSSPLELAAQLYGERRGDALVQRVLGQLRDALPEEAGPYHAPAVAARSLDALGEAWTPLLRAWMQRLANIAAAVQTPQDHA